MAISDLQHTPRVKTRKGPPCTVCEALQTLPQSEAEGLRRHLANPRYRYSQLAEDLRNDPDSPLDIASGTLSRHARGECDAREKCR